MEFRYPVEAGKSGQGRGNSGLSIQLDHEVQILDSYGLQGWWNERGALYKASPPKVNAASPAVDWQTYDVEYKASDWNGDEMRSAPRIEVRLNGVTTHHDEEIPHATAPLATGLMRPKGGGSIRLQDHGNAMQFRNIWLIR